MIASPWVSIPTIEADTPEEIAEAFWQALQRWREDTNDAPIFINVGHYLVQIDTTTGKAVHSANTAAENA